MDAMNSAVSLWTGEIAKSITHKTKCFDKVAQRAWDFLGKSYKDLYVERPDGGGSRFPSGKAPLNQVRISKARQFVNLYLPWLAQQTPSRDVEPDRPSLPDDIWAVLNQVPPGTPVPPRQPSQTELMDTQRAWLMDWWLNYIASDRQNNLHRETRTVLPEALVKGRAVKWHVMRDSPLGPIPFSEADSVDNLLIDSGCVQLRDADFVVRKCRRTPRQISQRFPSRDAVTEKQFIEDLRSATGPIKGAGVEHLSPVPTDVPLEDQKSGNVEYYEVYSRVGLGQWFEAAEDSLKEFADIMDDLGDNVFLAICPGVKYPLNVPPDVADSPDPEAELRERLQWPAPFHVEVPNNPWPCSVMDFLPNADNPWATSPLEGVLPLFEFLDHAFSYLMGRIKATSRDLIIAARALGERITAALESGLDQEIIPYDGSIAEMESLLHIIQFPPVNTDLWMIISAVERMVEVMAGMDPLMAGSQPESVERSSAGSQIRESHMVSRPNDYAECVRRWQGELARKEAFLTRLYVQPQTVATLFGEEVLEDTPAPFAQAPLTAMWMQLVATDDPLRAAAELSYSVQAGSSQPKNRDKMRGDAQILMQTMFQPLLGLAMQSGVAGPVNALIEFMMDAHEINLPQMRIPSIQPPQEPAQ